MKVNYTYCADREFGPTLFSVHLGSDRMVTWCLNSCHLTYATYDVLGVRTLEVAHLAGLADSLCESYAGSVARLVFELLRISRPPRTWRLPLMGASSYVRSGSYELEAATVALGLDPQLEIQALKQAWKQVISPGLPSRL